MGYEDFMSSVEAVFEFQMTATSGQLAVLKNDPTEPGRSEKVGLK